MAAERQSRDPILRAAAAAAEPKRGAKPGASGFIHLRVHSAYSLLEGALRAQLRTLGPFEPTDEGLGAVAGHEHVGDPEIAQATRAAAVLRGTVAAAPDRVPGLRVSVGVLLACAMLAAALGIYDPDEDPEPPRAVQIATALFLHEGNVARAGSQLIRHSNLGDEREQADFTPS